MAFEEYEGDYEARIVSSMETEADRLPGVDLRPKLLDEYVGQTEAKEQLRVYIEAARMRGDVLDHVLLYGPPGLGKTTLAYIMAHELNTNIRVTSGPAIEKSGDLVALITSLSEGDILFIDEIHRLNTKAMEALYSAMEDFAIDIVIGKGTAPRELHMQLPRFTLIGATTRAGQLSQPLQNRFRIPLRLELYSTDELAAIVKRSAGILEIGVNEEGAKEIASRSRGTPRIANRLLKSVRDYTQVQGKTVIDRESAKFALEKLNIDDLGLDTIDRRMLETIIRVYNGGPVGLDTLAATVGEEAITIEDVYEPYLMQIGFLQRTLRGRCATRLAYEHLGIPFTPESGGTAPRQIGLFDLPTEKDNVES